MKKQAQLTLMILTGIVILFAVFTVIWLGSKTAVKRTAPEAEQQRLRQIAVQPVREYVQNCLDVTTSAALELFGKQGGVLYQSQGGLTEDVQHADIGRTHIVYDNLNVSYVIHRPTEDIGTVFFANPPLYPFRTFPYLFKDNDEHARSIIATQTTGYFGKLRFPPLHKPGKESVQEQLETYIANNLPLCTDWQTFKNTHGLDVSTGTPAVGVMIAENLAQAATEGLFAVLANWTVTIADKTTGGETTLTEFSLSYPVHLAQFYLFVQSVVINDISNASYDPRNASAESTRVVVVENAHLNADGSGDDVIIVQDAQSVLRGRPLEFRALRKNRYPALVWANQTDLDDYRFIPAIGKCSETESIFLSGDDLRIKFGDPKDWHAELEALDPDEDAITFKTCPQSPAKIRVSFAGQDFNLDACASDIGLSPCGGIAGKSEDCQPLTIHTGDCPP
jgi:hypothetical protein